CNGDYIGFLDSDDFAEPETFEDLVKTATANDADYVACGYTDFYEENGKEITIHPYRASKPCKSAEDLYHDVWVSPWLHLYKADVIHASGVMFPEGVIYEDIAFFINLIPYLKKVTCIEKAYVHHRKHKASTMGMISLDRVMNILPVIDDVRNWYEAQGWNREFGRLCEYICVRILLCSSVERISHLKTFTERQTAIQKTMAYIRQHYPAYRRNPEFRQGARGCYMKMANRAVVTVMTEGLRMRN
ncbi:MAG: glycosyltransferase, partial [Lachnospiraceae bacterium]|nr:glycosyltransferase [Lachnospiraceae bacterium]